MVKQVRSIVFESVCMGGGSGFIHKILTSKKLYAIVYDLHNEETSYSHKLLKFLFKPDLRLNLYLIKHILAFQFGIINEN